MPVRPDDPNDPIALINKILARLRALERERLPLPDAAGPLQTFESGDPLGDTRFLDFGDALIATLVGDGHVEVNAISNEVGFSGARLLTEQVIWTAIEASATGNEKQVPLDHVNTITAVTYDTDDYLHPTDDVLVAPFDGYYLVMWEGRWSSDDLALVDRDFDNRRLYVVATQTAIDRTITEDVRLPAGRNPFSVGPSEQTWQTATGVTWKLAAGDIVSFYASAAGTYDITLEAGISAAGVRSGGHVSMTYLRDFLG